MNTTTIRNLLAGIFAGAAVLWAQSDSNFTVTRMTGETFTLGDALAAGKWVYVDFTSVT